MNLIAANYKWDNLAIDFWAFYRDTNMFFIYKNGEFLGLPFRYINDFNELLKTTKIQTTLANNEYWEDISENQPIIKEL